MRLTIFLDDDLVDHCRRLSHLTGLSVEELVNLALRGGLVRMGPPGQQTENLCTNSVDLGTCLFAKVDNVAEVVAFAEGDGYR